MSEGKVLRVLRERQPYRRALDQVCFYTNKKCLTSMAAMR